jgi:hypothetical protein
MNGLADLTELYHGVVGLLGRIGHLGGLLTLGFAGGSAWAAVWLVVHLGPWAEGPVWSPLGLLLGAVLALLSLTAFFEGLVLVVKGTPPRLAKVGATEFLNQVRRAPKPCLVCIDCRLLLLAAPCPGCGASSTCVDVADERDLKLVRAAVSPESE